MFTDKIYPMMSNGVSTIGGKDIHPKGAVKVIWSCTDGFKKLTQINIKFTLLYRLTIQYPK